MPSPPFYPSGLCKRLLPLYLTCPILLATLLSPLQAHAQRFYPRLGLPIGSPPLGIGIADLDADGRQEVLSTTYGGAKLKLTVVPNSGTEPGTLSFGARLDFHVGVHPDGQD